jgi:hypothetical protein
MSEFRYDNIARTFDDELEKEMFQLELEKAAKHQLEPESGIQRIAAGKTPLDEVKALIEASRSKNIMQEVAEHQVRKKLAAIRDRPREQVEQFLNLAKNV